MILVDTNVVIDVLERDERWFPWSLARLTEALLAGVVVINSIVLAESASRFSSLDEQLAVFAGLDVKVEEFGLAAAFVAGHRFRSYRAGSADRKAILADFLIGAHAAQLGAILLTRDARIYRSHFPEVTLITPETTP